MNNTLLVLLCIFLTTKAFGENNAEFVSQNVPEAISPGQSYNITVTFKNTGSTTWKSSDLYRLGTQSPPDNTIWTSSNRVPLPHDVAPGDVVDFKFTITAPVNGGIYALQWRMVQDGVEWFGQQSEAVYYVIDVQSSDTLLVRGNTFSVSSHTVSTSFFCWYGNGEWQVNGPWIPLYGRDSWDGSIEYWERMIKEAMAANIDVFYVELIPLMEQSRVAFFWALKKLREEGWNVPKVCPFLDPEITYSTLGYNGNCSTEKGKDELIGHYIRFYKQYYAANTDQYADDFIYTQDGHPVLNIWHIQIHIDNYDQLTREDVTNRLKAEFGNEHPIFNNDIRMINNAYSPCFSFCDERIYQFEKQEYKIDKDWKGINSSLLKPGYWDQNVRNPGYCLKRDGGSHYKDSWDAVNNDPTIDRVYIESFNEYDEGSGIYAARTDTIHRISSNTENDVWSATNDPWEYIKTTAKGAAEFNDIDPLNAKIVWENIPDKLVTGETFYATVVVQNSGDESWTNNKGFKFGQHDDEEVSFIAGRRVLIDDSQDEIPVYGGIFRGRAKTFNFEMTAPNTAGTYKATFGMLQEGVAWFGETITKNIEVSSTTAINEKGLKELYNIYPNPLTVNSNIHIRGNFCKNDRIIIYNITGKKIFENIFNSGKKELIINPELPGMSRGAYFVNFLIKGKSFSKKIIIKN